MGQRGLLRRGHFVDGAQLPGDTHRQQGAGGQAHRHGPARFARRGRTGGHGVVRGGQDAGIECGRGFAVRPQPRQLIGQLAFFGTQGFRGTAVHSFSLARNLSIA